MQDQPLSMEILSKNRAIFANNVHRKLKFASTIIVKKQAITNFPDTHCDKIFHFDLRDRAT